MTTRVKKTVFILAIIVSTLFCISWIRIARADEVASDPLSKRKAEQGAASFQTVPIWFHVHLLLKGDDGGEPSSKTVAYLKSKGYKGVVFSPHSGGIVFKDYKAEIDALNTSDFITVPGREISVRAGEKQDVRVLCHVNAISESESPEVIEGKYDWAELRSLITDLDKENAIYIWNHPWVCKRWEHQAGNFKGIELFNDFGPGYSDGSNYAFNKREYLEALKNGTGIFVVSSVDMHSLTQTMFGDLTTYMFPDEFTRESLVAAIRDGSTIAAFNSKIISISDRPSLSGRAVAGGSFEVKGKVAIKQAGGIKPALVIYKNGEEYVPATAPSLVRGKKAGKGYVEYDFVFGDTVQSGQAPCYVFEIPRYMFSSPYCYKP